MAGKSNNNATLFAQKKLLNKAHTSVLKSDAQETITTNIQPAAQTTFGQSIPANPEKTLYLIQSSSAGLPGTIEYVQFDIESISGTTYDGNAVDSGAGPEPSNIGPHAYALILTGNYESLSVNPKAGGGVFDNGKVLSGTLGQLQIIPPVFSTDRPNPYSVTLYKGDPTDSTNVIPLESEIDYQLDTYNGVLFVQDYDASSVPLFARAFIYIGDMVDTVIANSSGGGTGSGDGNAQYLVLAATGSLSAERVFTDGIGIDSTDAGAGAAFTVGIDNSVVATLTGSQFSGNVGITGSLGVLGDVEVAQYIKHVSDDNTFIQFEPDQIKFSAGDETMLTLREHGQDVVTVGGYGSNVDFQVSGSGDPNALFVDSSAGRVGMGTNSPSSILHIKEEGPTLTFQRESNSNASTIDFLGKLGNTANSIAHDPLTNDLVFKTFNGSTVEEILRLGDHYGTSVRQVTILSGANMAPPAMQPRNTSDIAFFVSGAIGSTGTSTRGTSVFGGDTVVSGAIHARGGLTGSLQQLSDGTPYLRSGAGISITTGSSGEVTVASTGATGLARSKDVYFVTSSILAGNSYNIYEPDFNAANYDFEKIDVFVNGQLLHSGSQVQVSGGQRDYYIETSTSLKFAFDLRIDDVLDVVVFSVSS